MWKSRILLSLVYIFCKVPWHPSEAKALEKCQVMTVRKGAA